MQNVDIMKVTYQAKTMDEQARKEIEASLSQTTMTDKQRKNAEISMERMLGPKPKSSILNRILRVFRRKP